MRSWLKNKINEFYPDIDFDVLTPPDEKMGDYSVNLAFVLAKKEGGNPREIGKELVIKLLNSEEFKKYFDKIELAGNGFINFYLSYEFLQKKLVEISSDKDYGQSAEGRGRKVIVEYSSPNIAKPMHIGHLRSTIIGDALANVYENLGYKVVRWNFIGDWGTQFGKIIAARKGQVSYKFKKAFPIFKNFGPNDTVSSMLGMYVDFSKKEKQNPELEEKARLEFKKLENKDEEDWELWGKYRNISLTEFKKVYSEININFEKMIVKGESDYEPELKKVIEELKKKGLVKESEGALIIELDNLPPAMLRKSDGATLYITRDIASLEDRIKNYHANKILYVVANQQALHFEQLFAIAKKLGWINAELVHVKFGMVLGEDGKKLATREGKVVPLQEVIDRLNDLAFKTVKEKTPNLNEEEAQKIARVVSIGALKYNDLKQHPYSDITFDWKAMLDLSGNSGPYIQYTYARLASILNKAGKYEADDLSMLSEPVSRTLMRHLLDFPEIIVESARLNTLNGLALYLYELAHRANQFYEQVRILEDENISRRNVRLLLVETTASVLKRGLNLLGIETLERI